MSQDVRDLGDDTPRWQGMSHQEIWEMVDRKPGHAVSQVAEGEWHSTWFTIQLVEAQLARAVAEAGSGWEGSAAESMTAGVTPLGGWALEASEKAVVTARALTLVGGFASYTRDTMPAPRHPDLPATAPDGIIVPRRVLEDWQAADVERDNAARRAQELMSTYTDGSYATTPDLAAPLPPPVVVLAGTGPDGGGLAGRGPDGAAGGAGPGTNGDATMTAPAGSGGGAVAGLGGSALDGPAGRPAGGVPSGPGGVPGAPNGAGIAPGAPPVPGLVPSGASGARPGAGGTSIPGGGGVGTGTPGSGRPADPARTGGAPGVLPGWGTAGTGGRAPTGGALGALGRGPSASWAPIGSGTGDHTGRSGGSGLPGGRPVADPLPPPARVDRGSPERPFPSSAPPAGDPAGRSTRPAAPGVMPMGAGAGMSGGREYRRPGYLVEDTDVFTDGRWYPSQILNENPEHHRG